MAGENLVKMMVYIPVPQRIALERYKQRNLPFSHIVSEALRIHFEEVAAGNRPIVDYGAINKALEGFSEEDL